MSIIVIVAIPHNNNAVQHAEYNKRLKRRFENVLNYNILIDLSTELY